MTAFTNVLDERLDARAVLHELEDQARTHWHLLLEARSQQHSIDEWARTVGATLEHFHKTRLRELLSIRRAGR